MGFDLTNPPTETIKLLAQYLTFVTKTNDKRIGNDRKASRFHAKSIPSIDILGYLTRILKYSPCGTECFLAILIYLERISVNGELVYNRKDDIEQLEEKFQNTSLTASSDARIIVDSYNVHRLIITSVLLGIKFLSDVFYTNLHVARVGGVPVQELNQLEVEFLRMSNFSLMISPNELIECGENLVAFCLSPRSSITSRSSIYSRNEKEKTTVPEEQHSETAIVTEQVASTTVEQPVTNSTPHYQHHIGLMMKLARNRNVVSVRSGTTLTRTRLPIYTFDHTTMIHPQRIQYRYETNTIRRGNYVSKSRKIQNSRNIRFRNIQGYPCNCFCKKRSCLKCRNK